MSDIIRLLPDSVANQIAAGEVIQRPSSVVKELVENAIDADATEIHVLITDAGRTAIQVIDNGKGMSETDARLSFERHATSKIRTAADLFDLHTKGFRGEALASIAAVAQVELKTRRPQEALGTRIVINGSELEVQEPVGTPVGSNFCVRNLFYNVPARRKFLKTNATELNNILTEFHRIVLVHPNISFTLHHNDSELFRLPAVTSLKQRIAATLGSRLQKELLDVQVDTSMVNIIGYVAKPETAKRRGNHQYFFVNGRFMKSPSFHKAVMTAYEKLLPSTHQISYFIYLEVDPTSIDVNIHPTKTEIKFENENAIWQILLAAVKESLGKFQAMPTIDFDTGDKINIPTFNPHRVPPPQPSVSYDRDYNPFNGRASRRAEEQHSTHAQKDWETLYSSLKRSVQKSGTLPTNIEVSGDAMAETADLFLSSSSQAEPTPASEKIFQYKGRYIVTPMQTGLVLIDQHRAHANVLYHDLLQRQDDDEHTAQQLLFPEQVTLTSEEELFFEDVHDEFKHIGFDLTSMGAGTYALHAVPAGIEGVNPETLFRNMLHEVMDTGCRTRDAVRQRMAQSLAKVSALVYGQVLSVEQMQQLVEKLFACPSPHHSPEGKVVVAVISQTDIDKLFS